VAAGMDDDCVIFRLEGERYAWGGHGRSKACLRLTQAPLDYCKRHGSADWHRSNLCTSTAPIKKWATIFWLVLPVIILEEFTPSLT